ncbi:PAS:GGDEF domain protein [Shewanella piezotolerans WP3]|uniref:PAS:GGDEF domain protein n=1 Tax=Shewanella piezotolerans (strain WP3 / JCM 13877) TaxID=225849 RepID=B8CQE4_SHEPW|nr:EAL domain-containing protein [Shewanella piezotolerans]ACJ30274.1 PAS:GGDEF domain protein [Shewanella piezotolerans WP3]
MNAHSTKNEYDPSPIKTSAISAKRYAAILAMLVGESPLKTVLHAIVRLIEEKKIGSKGSILLLSADGKRLLKAAAPNISEHYNNAIHGIEIGPNVGSCGAAAFFGQRVIVEDIATHDNWVLYRELPLSVGLKSCWSEPIIGADGRVLGTFAMYYSEVKSPSLDDLELISEAALLASLAIERDRSSRFQRLCGGIFKQMPLAILITDANGTVIDANPSFFNTLGSTQSELSEFAPQLVFGESSEKELVHLFQQIKSGNTWQGELLGRRADNTMFCADVNVTAFKDTGETEYSYAWIFADITDKKSAAEIIHYQAKFDPLTQLVNRPYLFEKIEQQINMSKLNPNACFSFILMDLDNFKQINDSLGHKLGDEVLIQVAERIKGCMGPNDILGRLGGDEFALIIPDEVCSEVLSKLVQQLNQVISQEYLLDSHQRVFTRLSAGISRFPQDACSLEQLLNCADQALFCAKEQGRNQFHFFNDQMQSDAERTAKLTNALKLAIENDAFELHYQPIVCAKQHRIRHVEALIRWRHDGRLVRPDEFISAAEASGLIIELGRWVRVEAMKTLLEFQALELDIGMSINVSTFEFWSHNLQDCLINSITETATKICSTGFPFHRLTLEITESLLMKEQVHLINSLSQLRKLGIKIAIDDFGTGYSSLSYLSEFPVDIIKIDKSFIRDVNDKKQAALVSAVVALSRALNLDVTVEGVESHLQLAFVSEKEVDSIQGYFFHKPLEKTALLEVLTKH